MTVPFLTASLWGLVRVVDCHGSNPGRFQRFSPWNYFIGGSSNLVKPVLASGSRRGLYSVVCHSVRTVDAWLSRNKSGNVLAQGHNTVTLVRLELGPLGLESSTLSLRSYL